MGIEKYFDSGCILKPRFAYELNVTCERSQGWCQEFGFEQLGGWCPFMSCWWVGRNKLGQGGENWEYVIWDMLIWGFLLNVITKMSNECQEGDANNMNNMCSPLLWFLFVSSLYSTYLYIITDSSCAWIQDFIKNKNTNK